MGIFLNESPARDMAKELLEKVKEVSTTNAEIRVTFSESDDYSNDSVHFNVYYKNTSLVRFSLTGFPSCSAIVISHNLYIDPDLREKGLATYLQAFKKILVKKYGCNVLQCTTVSENTVENHILQKHGWKVINVFVNESTGHECLQWSISL